MRTALTFRPLRFYRPNSSAADAARKSGGSLSVRAAAKAVCTAITSMTSFRETARFGRADLSLRFCREKAGFWRRQFIWNGRRSFTVTESRSFIRGAATSITPASVAITSWCLPSSIGHWAIRRLSGKKLQGSFERGPDKVFGERLMSCVKRGWPIADKKFLESIGVEAERMEPQRGRGRPRKASAINPLESDTNLLNK